MPFIDVDSENTLFVRLLERDANATVIAVSGEVDSANSEDLRLQVADLVSDQATGAVVLDLGELSFLGSAGIRALLDCRDIAAERGGRLEISRAHRNVREVLAICSLTELFHLSATEAS